MRLIDFIETHPRLIRGSSAHEIVTRKFHLPHHVPRICNFLQISLPFISLRTSKCAGAPIAWCSFSARTSKPVAVIERIKKGEEGTAPCRKRFTGVPPTPSHWQRF